MFKSRCVVYPGVGSILTFLYLSIILAVCLCSNELEISDKSSHIGEEADYVEMGRMELPSNQNLKDTQENEYGYSYRLLERAESHILHSLVFIVKTKYSMDELHEAVLDVSFPRFSKPQMTRQEVNALFSNPSSTSYIENYLRSQGVEVQSTGSGDYIKATTTVQKWNEILKADFRYLEASALQPSSRFTTSSATDEAAGNSEEGAKWTRTVRRLIRSRSFSLPRHVFVHVEDVYHTVQLPALRSPGPVIKEIKENYDIDLDSKDMNGNRRGGEHLLAKSCDGPSYICPNKLNKGYKIYHNVGSTSISMKKASQSVLTMLNLTVSPADLATFLTNEAIPNDIIDSFVFTRPNHVSDSICQSADRYEKCLEPNLDVQYLMGLSQKTPTIYYYADDMFDWVVEMNNVTDPALVISISYGYLEVALSKQVVTEFNKEAAKLSLMGTTIVVASGDDGVANFQARGKKSLCMYNPSFPASSPYVVAVGGTQGLESSYTIPEVSADCPLSGITSGGGFSTTAKAPEFQKAAIKGYFDSLPTTLKPVSGYSTSGRGLPDISLAANDYKVVVGGSTVGVSGTSASAPVFAAMVSLVNAYRMNKGKAPLGYINAAIYNFSANFTKDIISGNNFKTAAIDVNGNQVCTTCSQGFYATQGWDPVTGFGTVDFSKFLPTFYNLANYSGDFVPPEQAIAEQNKLAKPSILARIISILLFCAIIFLAGLALNYCYRSFCRTPMPVYEPAGANQLGYGPGPGYGNPGYGPGPIPVQAQQVQYIMPGPNNNMVQMVPMVQTAPAYPQANAGSFGATTVAYPVHVQGPQAGTYAIAPPQPSLGRAVPPSSGPYAVVYSQPGGMRL